MGGQRGGGPKGGGTGTQKGWGPKPRKRVGARRVGGPTFRAFFSFSRSHFHSFFLSLEIFSSVFFYLSGCLLVSFFLSWGVFSCLFFLSVVVFSWNFGGVLVGRDRPTKTPPKFHEKIPRERKKERKWRREKKKKRENLGGPAEGGPAEGGPAEGGPAEGGPGQRGGSGAGGGLRHGGPLAKSPTMIGLATKNPPSHRQNPVGQSWPKLAKIGLARPRSAQVGKF